MPGPVFDITIHDQVSKAGDDVKVCRVYDVASILKQDPKGFAFDHYLVLTDYIKYKGLNGVE